MKGKMGKSNGSKMKVNIFSDPIYDREEISAHIRFNSSSERPFDGLSHLVGKATSETSSLYKNMIEDNIMLHLTIARFSTTLSKKQKHDFTLILNNHSL